MQVLECLEGVAAMPWEKETAGGEHLRERLGCFRGPILSLLERNPALRPSMAAFEQTCHSVLRSSVRHDGTPSK